MDCEKHNIPLKKRSVLKVGVDKKGIMRPLWYCDLCEKEEEEAAVKKAENKKEEREKITADIFATMGVEELAPTDFTMFPTVTRTTGDPDPENACIVGGWAIIKGMFQYLQEKGVKPGAKLLITIEEV
jgi:hypothetical protein